MDKVKLYKYSIAALIFLNIAVIAFFLFAKPKHPPTKKHFRAELIKTLRLNKQQKPVFKKLAGMHNDKMKVINQKQQKLILPYFESLAKPNDSINTNNILTQYQQLEREKLEVTYLHFEEVKNLLNDEQLPLFEGLIEKFIDEVLLNKKNN